MPLVMFADESCTNDDSDFTAVGGYVAEREEWRKFEPKWEQVLCDYHVPIFHAVQYSKSHEKQLADKDSPYRDWDEAKRGRFENDLASVTRPHVVQGIVFLVKRSDYKIAFPKHTSRLGLRAYCFCTQGLFEMIISEWDDIFVKNPSLCVPGVQMGFVFDRVPKFTSRAAIIYQNMSTDKKDRMQRLGTFGMTSTKVSLPLQASDLLTYRTVKRVREIEKNGGQTAIRDWDEALGAGEIIRAKYHGLDRLKLVAVNAELEGQDYLRQK